MNLNDLIRALLMAGQITEDSPHQLPIWMQEIMASVTEGGRNIASFKLSLHLLERLPFDLAWGALIGWNSTNTPPLEMDELKSTFRSAYNNLKTTGKLPYVSDRSTADFGAVIHSALHAGHLGDGKFDDEKVYDKLRTLDVYREAIEDD